MMDYNPGWIWYLDIFFLSTTGFICAAGVFSKHFDDNILQRIGLAILCIASWGRCYYVYRFDIGQEIFVWYHFGVWSFAAGTYTKIYVRVFISKHIAWWHGLAFPYDRRKVPHDE